VRQRREACAWSRRIGLDGPRGRTLDLTTRDMLEPNSDGNASQRKYATIGSGRMWSRSEACPRPCDGRGGSIGTSLGPALTLAEIMAEAKALGPVPSAALPYLSKGEWALVASISHDVHRMAEFRAAADGV
jgi:hypothetical protein